MMLAGLIDCFGTDSRIIITRRYEHLLFSHGAETLHKVEELFPSDALLHFSWKAFRKPQPSEDFVELCLDVVRFSKHY